MSKVDIPTFDTFMNPVIQALKSLSGSGTIEEINNKVAEIAGLSDEQLEVLHNPEKSEEAFSVIRRIRAASLDVLRQERSLPCQSHP